MYEIKRILVYAQSCLMIVLAILLSSLCYQSYKKTSLEVISENKTQSLMIVSQKLDSVVSSSLTISQLIASDELILGTLYSDDISIISTAQVKASIDEIYLNYYHSFSEIDIPFYVICIGKNGFQYCSRSGYEQQDYSTIQSHAWFTKGIANKESFYLIPNFVDPSSMYEENNLAVIRNIYGSNQEYLGSVLIGIPESALANTYMAMTSEESDLYIIDALSIVISSTNKDIIGKIPFPLSDYTFTRNSKNYEIVNHNGEKYYSAKYKSPVTGWSVFQQIPLNIVLAPIHTILKWIIALTALSCLACIGFSRILAEQITKPIRQFSKKIQNAVHTGFHSQRTRFWLKEIDSLDACFDTMQIELNNMMEQVKQHEKDINTAKFNFLKAQINPHFLYNTLLSIKCMVAMNYSEQACTMLESFISLLRSSISQNDSNTTLLNECNYLTQYVTLQNIRYNEKIQLCLDIQDDLLDLEIPRFILQPLVENSIIHGMPEDNSTNTITVSFRVHAQQLRICVRDSGSGISPQTFQDCLSGKPLNSWQDTSHIGLANIHNRLVLIYGEAYGLSLEPDNSGRYFTVITLPLEHNPNTTVL